MSVFFAKKQVLYPEVSFAKVTISKRAMDQSVQVGCPKFRASSQNQKPKGLGPRIVHSLVYFHHRQSRRTVDPAGAAGKHLDMLDIHDHFFNGLVAVTGNQKKIPLKKGGFLPNFPSNQSIDFSLLHSQTHN